SSMGRKRSHSLPFTSRISAALARPGPMAAAISWPVTPRGNVMVLPSGKVMVTLAWGAADKGFSLRQAYLGDFLSGSRPGAATRQNPGRSWKWENSLLSGRQSGRTINPDGRFSGVTDVKIPKTGF